MPTLTLTDKEFELLSQALGEAVASADTLARNAYYQIRQGDGVTGKGYAKRLLNRHQALLHLMRKVDGGPN